MSDTTNSTPFSVTANSYCSLVEANAYHVDHVAADTWDGYDDEQKCRALIQATRQLDAYVKWRGWATLINTQVLAFPRIGLCDPGTEAIVNDQVYPTRLKHATAEQARLLLERDRSLETGQGQDGLSKLKAGSVELEFTATQGGGVLQAIAPSAWQFVQAWGVLNQSGTGGAVTLGRA